MNDIKEVKVMDSNEYKKWSKSTEKDGWCKKLKVEEIENGFLVCLEEYGQKEGKYMDTYKKYYSQTNPLGDAVPDSVDGMDELKDTIKNFLDY